VAAQIEFLSSLRNLCNPQGIIVVSKIFRQCKAKCRRKDVRLKLKLILEKYGVKVRIGYSWFLCKKRIP
jgi:2-polyprenyl-3-methyl-5-hydroxy-6-metoxy-1,4-benzoquinol methylase